MVKLNNSISVMDAINARHSTRNYSSARIESGAIHLLLDAAVRAPTAMHREPWAFVIVQDIAQLKHISDIAKQLFVTEIDHAHLDRGGHTLDAFRSPGFNIFYNASTLIVICAKQEGLFEMADCWLAAENLMLAACAMGLSTCVIGSAVAGLNAAEVKNALNIPAGMAAVAPIIVGKSEASDTVSPRKSPQILHWK